MAEKEQLPLAPATYRIRSDEEQSSSQPKKLCQANCLKCCGCLTALVLIHAVVILVLAFTVFNVKDPKIQMNSITVDHLGRVNLTTLTSGYNITLIADVSVKNPNIASFKFRNSSTTLYYRSTLVGEARNPPGKAKAQRTLRMNITVEIIPSRLLNDPNLMNDVKSGLLPMSSYTEIGGRVKILSIFRRHVVVKLNCTMTVNINATSLAIQEQDCKRHGKL